MPELDIATFCHRYGACSDGRMWALDNCKDMAEAWDKLPDSYLGWVATREGVLSADELEQFVGWLYYEFLLPFRLPDIVEDLWEQTDEAATGKITEGQFKDHLIEAKDHVVRMPDGRAKLVASIAIDCCQPQVTACTVNVVIIQIRGLLTRVAYEGVLAAFPDDFQKVKIAPSRLRPAVREWVDRLVAKYIRRTFANPFRGEDGVQG